MRHIARWLGYRLYRFGACGILEADVTTECPCGDEAYFRVNVLGLLAKAVK